MKTQLLRLLLLASSLTGFAQSEYDLVINGTSIKTKDDFKSLKARYAKSALLKSNNKQMAYSLMQFNKPITAKDRAELLNKGIKIIDVFTKNTYYVALTPGFYEKNASNSLVRTIIPIKTDYKIDPVLTTNQIPDYAKKGDLVEVVVSYFKGTNPDLISQELTNTNFKDFRISKDFHQIYLKVSTSKLSQLATHYWVQNIEPIAAPDVIENTPGRNSHRVNVLASNIAGLGYGLTGNGVKIGIWDGNVEPHKDATGRLITREYESPSTHGSHVFGTMAGAGIIDPIAKGMAPKATVYAWNFNTQSNRLQVHEERLIAANNDGVELTQNSYGANLKSGFSTLRYSAADRGDDDVMAKKNYFLTMYSNGNAQAANLAANGFNTTTKNSKNPLHVGANDPNESISNYSSFGPSPDGRLFPQVSAIGSEVYSMSYGNSYEVMSGTSMATPGVTGTVALLYEQYKTKFGQKPLASLIKAIVCNTATEIGNIGPDYKYGFGGMNGLKAAETINDTRFYTATIANGETNQKVITVPAGTKQVKVMLCYTDLPGVPGNSSVLVNNLDIKVLKNGVEYLPWVLDPTQPNMPATKGIDNLNNIEQVTINTPESGEYTIVIYGKNIPLDSQEFAVTYEFVKPYFRMTYPIGNEKLIPNTTEYIRWEYEGEPKPFVVQYSTDAGNTYTTIAELPANARNYAWIVPNIAGINTKVRVINGTQATASKELFTIMQRPTNLKVNTTTSCGINAVEISWTPVANAKYEVLKLNENSAEFEKIGETSNSSYTISDITTSSVFTVRAIDGATNAVSERAIAVIVNPIATETITANKLPYKEDFETLIPKNITLEANPTGSATLGYWSPIHKNGIVFAGKGIAGTAAWTPSKVTGYGATATCDAFTNNPSYVKKATFCSFDASTLTGKKLLMSFDLRFETANFTSNKIFTRVLVNGNELVSHEGTKYYTGAIGLRNPIYDLSAYSGTNFTVEIQTVIDDNDKNTTSGITNSLSVDNFTIYEAQQNDVTVSFASISAGTLNATSTAISVDATIQNLSGNPISNIPVNYTINNGTPVTEIVPGPINAMETLRYTFTTKANLSAIGAYDIVVTTTLQDDLVTTNNKYAILKKLNNGNDILIGSMPSGSTKSEYKTCNATFTDEGGRASKYTNLASPTAAKTTTFIPETADKKIKVEFTEFALEDRYDYLKIYNGPSKSAPLIGSYTGNTLPNAITSSAVGGELTFEFVPDDEITDNGFVANISCADYVSFIDAAVVSIKKPDFMGKKTNQTPITILVKNNGNAKRDNLPVYYQVNGGTKVEEVITSINPLTELEYTFTTMADLTTNADENVAYEITAGINETDTDVNNNLKVKKVYNKYTLPNTTNTDGYAITNLKWGAFENNSGTTAYSNFKDKIIPVFKGLTTNPFITISKPDLPIARPLSLSSGVFTMMVIDLNNDGNFADEYYALKYWVNTEANDTKGIPSTTGVHYFKEAATNIGGIKIDPTVTNGEHNVRLIHMYRSPAEGHNVILGPTKDGLTTSRTDFEIEEYTINIMELPAVDAQISQIIDIRPRVNNATDITVSVRNNSITAPINNFDIAYKINDGNEVAQTITTEIPANTERRITFTTKADLKFINTYKIEAYTKLADDLDSTNDKKTIIVNHVDQKPKNSATNFDGADDVLETRTTPAYDLTNNFTLEAWYQLKKPLASFGRVFDKSNISVFAITNTGHSLYKANSWIINVSTTPTGSFALNTDENTLKLNKWQHIAVSVSPTNEYKVYIDGVQVNTRLASGSKTEPVKTNLANPLLIGNNATLTRGFIGNIDELRVWNTERTAEQIANTMTTSLTGNEANLIAYFPMSENEESFVYDKSINDNTALAKNTDASFWETPTLLNSFSIVGQNSIKFNPETKTFTVYVPDTFDKTNAKFDFSTNLGAILKYNNVKQESTITTNEVQNNFQLKVEGIGFNNQLEETYNVTIEKSLSAQAQLLSYSFKAANNPVFTTDSNATITGVNVSAVVNSDNLSNLIANFEISPNATLTIDGVLQQNGKTTALDYNQKSVVLCVIAQDGETKNYYEINVSKSLANNIFDNNTLNIYPNPVNTNGKLFINCTGSAILYDTVGRKVLSVPTFMNTINLEGVQAGNYVLHITDEKGNKTTNKIIVK